MVEQKSENLLTRKAILEAGDYTLRKVAVPEWGGAVYVKTLTGAEKDSFEQEISFSEEEREEAKKAGKKCMVDNFRARLLVRCLCDADGNKLFDYDDVAVLGAKSAKALERCFEAAGELNALSKKDLEKLEKNSD